MFLNTYTHARMHTHTHIPTHVSAQSLSCILLFATPWAVTHQALLSMGFPDKNTGEGDHFLLQGTFPTQGSKPHLLRILHWQVDSLPLCHLGSPYMRAHTQICTCLDKRQPTIYGFIPFLNIYIYRYVCACIYQKSEILCNHIYGCIVLHCLDVPYFISYAPTEGQFVFFCSALLLSKIRQRKKLGKFLSVYIWDRFLEVQLLDQRVNGYVTLLDTIKFSYTRIIQLKYKSIHYP